MAVMLSLDFDGYFLPPVPGDHEFHERIAANNAEVDLLKKRWKEFQDYENQALPLWRTKSWKGVTYYNMQDLLAAAITTAIEIMERERVLHDSLTNLVNDMGAAQVIEFPAVNRVRQYMHKNHMACLTFGDRVRSHLSKTLFVDLQIG